MSSNLKMLKCCVPNCPSPSGIYLHTFPNDYELFLKWISAIKREDLSKVQWRGVRRTHRVCTSHFSENHKYSTADGRYTLTRSAHPTLLLPEEQATVNNENIPCSENAENNPPAEVTRVKRKYKKRKQKKQVSPEEEEADEYVNFDDMCRVCLTSSEQLTDIKTVSFGELSVSDVFEQYIAIKMDVEDDLPKQLCTTCLYELCRVYLFINNCREADVKLKELVLENAKVNSETELNGPVRTKEPGPPYICNVCSTSFESLSEIKKHRTLFKHHKSKKYTCKLCTTSKMYSHRAWKEHMRVHTGEKPYECHICGKRFTWHSNKSRHLLTHSGVKPYSCNYCGKAFSQRNNLKNHKFREHMGQGVDTTPGDFGCEQCQKVFTTQAALSNHRVIHFEKKYLCSECGKPFHYKNQLNRHMETHERIRQYQCDICDKRFAKALTLNLHKRTHSGYKPYECAYCQRRFSQRPHLTAHTRTHTGERPYRCPYCDRSFALNGNLTTHIRKHTGENPYVCDICVRGFSNSSSLKKHRSKHFEGLD